MNLDYERLEQDQKIKKIASSTVSNEEIAKMLVPYLDRRKMAYELSVKNPDQRYLDNTQEFERIINYCNTQIKLILLLN